MCPVIYKLMLFRYSCQLEFDASLEDLMLCKIMMIGFDFVDSTMTVEDNSVFSSRGRRVKVK